MKWLNFVSFFAPFKILASAKWIL